MAKLILEESGKRRAFRVGDGVLSVGSGAEAKLRVEAPDIAEIHFELELTGTTLKVRPRPGVTRPTIDGRTVEGDSFEVEAGAKVRVGGTCLWIEKEGAEAPPKPAPFDAEGKRAQRLRSARSGRDRSKVRRSKTRVTRGIPSWLIVGGVLATVAIVLAFARRAFESQVEQGAGPVRATIQSAEEQLGIGNFDMAVARLDTIPAGRDRTPAEGARIAELRDEIEERRAEAALAVGNFQGTKYLAMLKKHEAKWLVGNPAPSKVRYFCKQMKVFRERWPQHPDMGWIDRQEGRLRGRVDLNAAPTWDDIDWEIKYIVAQSVRDYAEAFDILDTFIATAAGDDLVAAADLKEKLTEERVPYHKDRLQQARFEYERKEDPAKTVWWLLNLVVHIGDEGMADEAAKYLVKIPRLDEHLKSYARQYPDRYRRVLRHPLVREFAKSKELIP